MGKFAKFLGKVEFKIREEDIVLKNLTVEDAQEISDLSKNKDNEIVKGVDTIVKIFTKSYPEEPKEELEAFVLKNYGDISDELIIALGWLTREKLEKVKKEEMEKLSEKKNQ